GLACARADNNVGMAWGCSIATAAVGDWEGVIPDVVVQNAMHSMADRADVRVVNISYGFSDVDCLAEPSEWLQRWNSHWREHAQILGGPGKRILWTISAGNLCGPLVASPMALAADGLKNVISVAATNADRSLASFSDYGDDVEVAAPGGIALASGGKEL